MNIADVLKLLLGAIGGNGIASPVEISKQILAQFKKALKSLIILFIGTVSFCILIGYLIDRALTQLDAGSFVITNSIIFLLSLLAINLLVIFWALNKASSKDDTSIHEIKTEVRRTDSAMETAIAALILNFIKEREVKHGERQTGQTPTETSQTNL